MKAKPIIYFVAILCFSSIAVAQSNPETTEIKSDKTLEVKKSNNSNIQYEIETDKKAYSLKQKELEQEQNGAKQKNKETKKSKRNAIKNEEISIPKTQ